MADARAGLERLSLRYAELVAAGEIEDDPAQSGLTVRFDSLNEALSERRLARKGSALGWLFASRSETPKGLYIHGEVGRGKTMLMDAFFAVAVPARKRRTHFNEFMAEVHDRIHAFRQTAKDGGGDPIGPLAAALSGEVRLLCLDEFAVEDIADAMILSRLFGELFARGLVLVATSNTAPDDLYRGGLNRDLFLPFVAVLKRQVDVIELKARTDYRLAKLGCHPVYVTPLGPAADAALDRAWLNLTGSGLASPLLLTVKGREVRVPRAARGMARFTFADLCARPLGNSDYLQIARTFHTVMVDRVPVLRDEQRDQARRFVNLIDTLYDNGVKLVASAAAEPEALYTAASGGEAFAFRRTASRLIEMRSAEYLAASRAMRQPADSAT